MKRRTFMQRSATMATLAATHPRWSFTSSPVFNTSDLCKNFNSESVSEIGRRAVEAAITAGATYAEARLGRHLDESILLRGAAEEERHGMSVRAIVRGGWGFAASPVWTLEEAVYLGCAAARQAVENAKYAPTPITLAPTPPATGTWKSSMKIDPWTVSVEEKCDTLAKIASTLPYRDLTRSAKAEMNPAGLGGTRTEHTLVTSEGTAITQTLSLIGLTVNEQVGIDDPFRPSEKAKAGQLYLVQGNGWESIRDYDFSTRNQHDFQQLFASLHKPPVQTKPLDIGRYTVVLGPEAMRAILILLVGLATDLDLITLREMNTVGTSYLGQDPAAMLGAYDFGSPLLSVTATPWAPDDLLAHKWDNEGVIPESVPVIKHGILQDFATTREQAMWLEAGYRKLGRPLRTYGYSALGEWDEEPARDIPAFVMTPSTDGTSLADLAATVQRGVYIERFFIPFLDTDPKHAFMTDFQMRQTVLPIDQSQEIVNGRLRARFARGRALVCEATQIWKNLVAIGGAASQAHGAVPGLFKDMPIVNPLNKA